jgi:hypothetical protein
MDPSARYYKNNIYSARNRISEKNIREPDMLLVKMKQQNTDES